MLVSCILFIPIEASGNAVDFQTSGFLEVAVGLSKVLDQLLVSGQRFLRSHC